MHEKVLPKHSRQLLARLEADEAQALKGWVLAGGTGLALQLGHRISEDFDFFRKDEMPNRDLHEVFSNCGHYEVLQEDKRTLTVIVQNTKLSFFSIPDPFLFETRNYSFFKIADVRDIALMKLVAVSSRGSKKDFVDLYTILRGELTLQTCFELLPEKYPSGRANSYHILKSLTYFSEAEQEPMPRTLEPFDWEECKAFFIREAHAIVLGP